MIDIPDGIMGKAKDLSCEGCSCSEEEAASCERMGSICWHQAHSIARALMEAEARGEMRMHQEAAKAVALCGDPSMPIEAESLARWCADRAERTCLSGAMGLCFLETIRRVLAECEAAEARAAAIERDRCVRIVARSVHPQSIAEGAWHSDCMAFAHDIAAAIREAKP